MHDPRSFLIFASYAAALVKTLGSPNSPSPLRAQCASAIASLAHSLVALSPEGCSNSPVSPSRTAPRPVSSDDLRAEEHLMGNVVECMASPHPDLASSAARLLGQSPLPQALPRSVLPGVDTCT